MRDLEAEDATQASPTEASHARVKTKSTDPCIFSCKLLCRKELESGTEDGRPTQFGLRNDDDFAISSHSCNKNTPHLRVNAFVHWRWAFPDSIPPEACADASRALHKHFKEVNVI